MGIINLSAHSFYGAEASVESAYLSAMQMIKDGAAIIDLGAEPTNPHARLNSVSAQQQQALLLPLIKKIRSQSNIDISVDTSDAEVMQAAVAVGATMINDQRALQQPGAMAVVAASGARVCLMHGLVTPRQPNEGASRQLLQTIKAELQQRVQACLAAGINAQQIVLDPGFGGGHFGKSTEENFYLLANLHELQVLGFPLLIGVSRKSMIGDALGGATPSDRLYGSLAAATVAMMQGVAIIRTHDVKATVDCAKVVRKMLEQGAGLQQVFTREKVLT